MYWTRQHEPCGSTLYALAQGEFAPSNPPGSPAQENTGQLLKVNDNGTLTVVVDGLNRPTWLEIIGNTAYVVTLSRQIWTIDNISKPAYGGSRRMPASAAWEKSFGQEVHHQLVELVRALQRHHV
jgi:hypothetical protein